MSQDPTPSHPIKGEGRRDARKRATRHALHAAAITLMSQRGFQATTIADIAAAAGVAPRTFFSYFPSKEVVLYEPLEDIVSRLEHALATADADADAFTVLRTWLRDDAMDRLVEFTDTLALVEKLAQESDSVAVHGLRYMDTVTAAVAAKLRRDMGLAPGSSAPELAASAAVATFSAALRVGGSVSRDHAASSARMIADFDDAERFVRAGIAALRGH